MLLSKKNIGVNFLGFLIVGGAGILINIFLIYFYDAEILGRFNFFYTCVILLSQLSAGGVQFSVLKHNAHFYKRNMEVSSIVVSALFLSSISSSIVLLVLYSLASILEALFELTAFTDSILFIMPAIMFFSFNKILMMALNGLNRMADYAVFNSLRYLLLLLIVVLFYLMDMPEANIPVILSISEALLFLLLLVYMYIRVIPVGWPKSRWIKRHFLFGIRSLPGGALMEINTRVDVLMIGAFLGYSAVGIYSFAAMIAEGFAQVFTVLKNNVDPVFGSAYHNKDTHKIFETIYFVRKKYIALLIVLGISLIVLYQAIFIELFRLDKELINQSWDVLLILMTFILLSSFYRPFIGLLIQINKPHLFSFVIFFSVTFNLILNSLLIPVLGLNGAAISTGIAFILESYLLYTFALRTLRTK